MEKSEISNILEIKGETRGVVFETDKKYVVSKWGENGLKKVREKAKELGFDIPYDKVNVTLWYSLKFRIASLLIIKEVFNLGDKEIREMGAAAPKASFIVKFLFSLFLPLSKFIEEIPRYWEEHYTIGELKVEDFSDEKKIMVMELKGFELHPAWKVYLEGYLETVGRFFYPTSVCKTETEPKKKKYYRFTVTWQ